MHADLSLALALADAADDITMKFFRDPVLGVRTKSDLSPVSEADEATERAIRSLLDRDRPGDEGRHGDAAEQPNEGRPTEGIPDDTPIERGPGRA